LPEAKSEDVFAVFLTPSGRIWYTGCCNHPHGDYETLASLLGSRDMSLYEDGGDHSSPCFQVSAAEPDCGESLAYARKFIWSHWHNKLRGYLRITFCRGDRCTEAHLFIEPDKNGDWRVVEYYDRGCDLDDARFERIRDITNVMFKRATKADYFPAGSLFLKMTGRDGDDESF